jgi:aconitate hydratase
MGMNLVEKIVRDHLVEGTLEGGGEIGIRIDQTLTQDATGTMVYLQFESMGLDRIRAERAVSYVDHNTVQVGPENADDHAYLQSAAARFGAVFSKPGNGICHQLHLERFGEPGKTLLGSDSHTPTGGGLGMLAIGAGGLDVAVAMGGGPFYLPVPRVVRVALRGRLGPWISAKDVILKMLERLGTRGNVGAVLEYGGPGVRNLDVPERATIANMGAECGVTTSVFPSDALTRAFLAAQGRADAWRELQPDKDAVYAETLELDLGALEPLAAEPHSPGNIVPVAALAGLKVNQVLIGSCTNSSYRDLKTVARLLAGRRVHPDVSLGIAPGSRQVVAMLAAEGALGDLLAAGARLLENACGFCIGNSMSPGTRGVSLRTSNRNFEGRSGTPSGRVYLVSPETAAVAAVTGRVIDPRASGDFTYPRVRRPKTFTIDDGLLIMPPADGSAVEIVRGPGIRPVPANAPLPERLSGAVAIKVGDNITTDHIMPAGARLKYRSNIETYSGFVFEGVDPGFAARAARNRDAGVHNVIVAGESYGQGSSREHAALCPMYLGVKAVVARSFERIHLANLINFGIIPFRFEKADDYDRLAAGDPLEADGLRAAVAGDGRAVLRVPGKGLAIAVRAELTERQKRIVLAGGLLNAVSGEEKAE